MPRLMQERMGLIETWHCKLARLSQLSLQKCLWLSPFEKTYGSHSAALGLGGTRCVQESLDCVHI